jgi:hypothetical protein
VVKLVVQLVLSLLALICYVELFANVKQVLLAKSVGKRCETH